MLFFYRTICALFIGLFIACFWLVPTKSSEPLLANYILGTLPRDSASLNKLSQYDLLILSPEQGVIRTDEIRTIKQLNPDIILLAYVSTKSRNQSWDSYPANTLFKDFYIDDGWWLRDTSGNIISVWPGLQSLDMGKDWSDYLISFVKNKILTQGFWDGVFWDEVYDGASWINNGNVDLDKNGVRDSAAWLDNEWMSRINYLLTQSRSRLGVRYIITNGSSNPVFQSSVNGRMFETFPTPWEGNGTWEATMNSAKTIQQNNRSPGIIVFNANTANTGNQNDYRKMRFGLGSSLLLDGVYYSFDYGDQDHNQIWLYDEYGINLGAPLGASYSQRGYTQFQQDIWRRDFENGIALVNSLAVPRTVSLNGEYEKINGEQDKAVNDGSITDTVSLSGQDAILMLKTFQQAEPVKNLVFKNGSFLQFFDLNGNRVRNGFFAFDENSAGGSVLYEGDLDGVVGNEKITMEGHRFQIFNDQGQRWYNYFPFGGNFTGQTSLAVDNLFGLPYKEILLAGENSGKIIMYNYHGKTMQAGFYPFGFQDKSSFFLAVGNLDGGLTEEAVLGVNIGRGFDILIYDNRLSSLKKRFTVGYNIEGLDIACGDFNGDGLDEIAAVFTEQNKMKIKIFNQTGEKISEFEPVSGFFGNDVNLGSFDADFNGRDDVVLMSQ